jgi:hypothetical protein
VLTKFVFSGKEHLARQAKRESPDHTLTSRLNKLQKELVEQVAYDCRTRTSSDPPVSLASAIWSISARHSSQAKSSWPPDMNCYNSGVG